jgi:hypothetical protein
MAPARARHTNREKGVTARETLPDEHKTAQPKTCEAGHMQHKLEMAKAKYTPDKGKNGHKRSIEHIGASNS